MWKRTFIFFVLMLLFSMMISAEFDIQHIFASMIITLIVVWFWRDLNPRLPIILSLKELALLGRCLIFLVGYIIESNVLVAKTLLFSNPAVSPVFVVMQPHIKSNWGRILLATCITITPGTVTIDIDPETGRFIVHALTKENAMGLPHWRMIDEIRKLEIGIQKRREKYAVDTSRAHDADSSGTL
ncbi:MAG: Na+/H+ antiporter subunit E [Epulopiscium sp.]|nr:Na+/H+ antiporter subunit E [Candidatus Epulonipiscium sp.]